MKYSSRDLVKHLTAGSSISLLGVLVYLFATGSGSNGAVLLLIGTAGVFAIASAVTSKLNSAAVGRDPGRSEPVVGFRRRHAAIGLVGCAMAAWGWWLIVHR